MASDASKQMNRLSEGAGKISSFTKGLKKPNFGGLKKKLKGAASDAQNIQSAAKAVGAAANEADKLGFPVAQSSQLGEDEDVKERLGSIAVQDFQ